MEEDEAEDILQDWLTLDRESIPKYIVIVLIIVAIIAGILFISSPTSTASSSTSTITTKTIQTTSSMPFGAINMTILYGNEPAGGAVVTISGYYKGKADADGFVSTGLIMSPGTYDVHATYNGSESSINLSVSSGQTTLATLILPGPIITVNTTTTANTTTTIRVDSG